MKKILFCGLLVFLSIFSTHIMACTTILVGKDASSDGSVIVSHSDDNELGDQRIIYVPASDYEPGSKRPVYYDPCCFNGSGVYRYVGTSRGPGYDTRGLPKIEPLGYIEQVPHTYAYLDGDYGIMNEHQLMIGECTDGVRIEQQPKKDERIFYSAELSRVALERCTKAVDAIRLMGELIERYGYYGTGETLLVGDKEEGWVFEMAPSPDGKGGLWVAKRVTDDEVFIGANEFRIREIDPDDPNMMFSKNLHEIAQKQGWWEPDDGKLDWLKTVSAGEYNHPYYSLRRVWSVLRRVKPSADYSPWVSGGYTKEYPFSIKPDKKLSVSDVIALHRDHYEGTEFDMTKGIAAGPFGTPNRFTGDYDGKQNDVNKTDTKMWGAWERPISVFYCGFLYVNQARSWLPDEIGGVCWFGPDRPSETCFVPFYAGVTDLPKAYQTGTILEFDRDVAWWAFNFVSNWADLKYEYMIKDIRSKQKEIEDKEFAMQPAVEIAALELYKKDPNLAKRYLTDYCTDNANRVVNEWWKLADSLIVKYDDGYVNEPKDIAKPVGYPEWWLKEVGYDKGPITYKKPEE